LVKKIRMERMFAGCQDVIDVQDKNNISKFYSSAKIVVGLVIMPFFSYINYKF